MLTSGYLNILSSLSEMEKDTIYIQELEMTLNIKDSMTIALLFSAMPKYDIDSKLHIEAGKLDLKKALEAKSLLESINKNNISYVIFIGKKADETLKLLEDKWKDKIVRDNGFSIIRQENKVLIPVERNTNLVKDLKALSTNGLTVMNIFYRYLKVYIQGKEATRYQFDDLPLIHFVNTIGFFIEEFLFGELLYYISKHKKGLEDILINNMETKFVQSLLELFNDKYFKFSLVTHKKSEDEDFNVLLDILENYAFDRVKDFSFNFVRKFIYDKD